jgi:hypothetical protein
MGFIPIYKIAGGVKKMSKVFRSFLIVLGIVFALEFLPANAEAVYLDLRFGMGTGSASLDGTSIEKVLSDAGVKDYSFEADDFGFKVGVGPYFENSLYVVGEFEMIAQRYSFRSDWVQYDAYLIGPGIVYYPMDHLQLGATIGYAFGADGNSQGDLEVGGYGIGYSLSVAYDIQVYNSNAFLIGWKWTQAVVKRDVEMVGYELEYNYAGLYYRPYTYMQTVTHNQTSLTLFIGYAFRTNKRKDTSRQSLAPAENQDNLSTYQHSSSRSSNGENSNYQNSSSANSSPSQRERELEKENAMLKGKVEAYEKMLNTRK